MNTMIQTEVEGVPVWGRITYRCSSDLSVEILSPYYGLKNGRHIPHFALKAMNFRGDYGDQSAPHLLAEVYQFARFISREHVALKAIFDEALQSDCHAQIGRLSAEEARLRKCLRKKEGDARSHQLALKSLRRERSDLSFQRDMRIEKQVSEQLGVDLTCDEREYLLRMYGDLLYLQ